mmetsp:Transcript_32617/g.67371  ORF Transcript_32617/g.67371 Transcript_32617/m.67371 type:complete len:275 (+) Transcript_32617:154-978(+)
MSSFARTAFLFSLAFLLAPSAAEPDHRSNDCDTCRTIVERFYQGWEKTISRLAADGTFESRPGGAPKITYNQDIEDYLQGFCDSEYMKDLASFVDDGCRRIMKEHHRAIVGKFLHGEERYGATLTKTDRPERVMSVCRDIAHVCPTFPLPHLEVKAKEDKCNACKSTVADALYLIRRSRLGALTDKALKKKRLDVYELLENLCTETYYRHDDMPDVHNTVCSDMFEEDEDGIIDTLVSLFPSSLSSSSDAHAQRKICASSLSYCSDKDFPKAEL